MCIAVILFNLGGPKDLDEVKPFLQNLFSDKAIIDLPKFIRYPLANFIATRRTEKAKKIYESIGGGTPLLPNTQLQAQALEDRLNANPLSPHYKCFVSMRYTEPRADTALRQALAYAPDHFVFLPLYPQYSASTTASSFADFSEELKRERIDHVPVIRICCYPALNGFIDAQVEAIVPLYKKLREGAEKAPRILFSAHGLPEKMVKAGDPYQKQCEQTVQAIVETLGRMGIQPDYQLCYQSRVGPLKWIGPSTEDEIARAGADGAPVLVVPMSFVSEHSETLYEIDQEYKHLAAEKGVPLFMRTQTVGAHPAFIESLARLIETRVGGAKQQDICGGLNCKNVKCGR